MVIESSNSSKRGDMCIMGLLGPRRGQRKGLKNISTSISTPAFLPTSSLPQNHPRNHTPPTPKRRAAPILPLTKSRTLPPPRHNTAPQPTTCFRQRWRGRGGGRGLVVEDGVAGCDRRAGGQGGGVVGVEGGEEWWAAWGGD